MKSTKFKILAQLEHKNFTWLMIKANCQESIGLAILSNLG